MMSVSADEFSAPSPKWFWILRSFKENCFSRGSPTQSIFISHSFINHIAHPQPFSLTHLMVMEVERHLQVQAHKLGQVPVRVAVLRPKHGAHCVDTLKVTGDGHLLVELRRLGQVGGALEVADLQQSRKRDF